MQPRRSFPTVWIPLFLATSVAVADGGPCRRWNLDGIVIGDELSAALAGRGKVKRTRNPLVADGLGKRWRKVRVLGPREGVQYVLANDTEHSDVVVSVVARWDLGIPEVPNPQEELADRWGAPRVQPGSPIALADPDVIRTETSVWDDPTCDVRALAIFAHVQWRNPDPMAPIPRVGETIDARALFRDTAYYVILLSRLSEWEGSGP